MRNNIKTTLFTPSYLITFTISIFVWFAVSLLTSVVPLYLAKNFFVNSAEIGVIIGVSNLSTIIARPFMGYALDFFGRKRILFLSLMSCGIINIAYIFTATPAAVFAVRIIQGIPFASSTTALVTVASDLVPENKRKEGLSYFTLTSTLGLAMGPGFGIFLFNISRNLPFILAAIVSFVCFAATFLVVIPDNKSIISTFSINDVFDKRITFIAMIVSICCLGIPGLLNFVSFYANQESISMEYVNYAYTVYAFGLLSTRLMSSHNMAKQSSHSSGVVSITMFFIGMIMLGLWRTSTGLLIASFILGGGMGVILPTILIMAINIAPEKKGVCNALVFDGLDISFSFGAFLFGAIVNALNNFGITFILFSIFDLIALIIFIFIIMPYYQKERKISVSL